MGRIRSPFACVDGRPYLIVNFDLEPTGDLPPLPELLHQLLAHQQPKDVLILRRLSRKEARVLAGRLDDAQVEAWAGMVVKHEDRLRPRKKKRR